MKERPILFSGPMVRAILDGRKTVTRRAVKMTASGTVKEPRGHRRWHPMDPDVVAACPYGVPGDTLWVRETWLQAETGVQFQATPQLDRVPSNPRWRPSIHMPRWASRITLEVTEVRIERLKDITEEDARAEGITDGGCLTCGENEPCGCDNPRPDARDGFAGLWQDINGPDSWHDNPWVWVITFRRLQP